MPQRHRRTLSLEKLLGPTETPVFVVTARRTMACFNAGCERLTGWPAGEILGTTCEYAEHPDPRAAASVAGSLCPPPDAFAGKPACVPAYVPHRDGRSAARMINYFPLVNEAGKVEAVLGVITSLAPPKPAVAATAAQQLHAELAAQRNRLQQRFGLRTVFARGAEMLRVLKQAQLARGAVCPVLIQGEPGTGRAHLARVIHNESEFRSRSFVPIDCERLPAFELKQTLRRLLTRDPEDRRGESLPPILQPGTVYLHEAGFLPLDVQEFLAEALTAERAALPVRTIAGTSADLREAVRNETFRDDLYFALTAMEIDLPALRRRRDELPLLAQAFLEELNRGAERQVGGFSDDVHRQFAEYNWPGNLDELLAVITEARQASSGPLIQTGDLPFRFRTGMDAQALGPPVSSPSLPLEQHLEQVERERIEAALDQARFNKSRAADLLGIPRPKLYRRMEALKIQDRESPEG